MRESRSKITPKIHTGTRPRSEGKVGDTEIGDVKVVEGLSGEAVRILKTPKTDEVEQTLKELYDEGFRSIAVCLMHGYTFPQHEALVGKLARDMGFDHVSLSHELMPMIKLIPRATLRMC